MWRQDGRFVVDSERGRVTFARAEDGVRDERGHVWSYEGDLAAIGGVIEGGRIRTPEYPLAMWRIASALECDRVGDVVATMKLTYEAADIAGGDHRGGGDHASLHAQDSTVPFLSTLADPPVDPVTIQAGADDLGRVRALVARAAVIAGSVSAVVAVLVAFAAGPLASAVGGHESASRAAVRAAALGLPFIAVANVWLAATRGLKIDPDLRVSVNVSGRQLEDPDLVDDIETALRDRDMPPGSLTVEIV